MRSIRACEVWLAPSACHAIRLPSGLKKAKTLPPLSSTLSHPKEPQAVCLELDEPWSFVRQRANVLDKAAPERGLSANAGFGWLFANTPGKWRRGPEGAVFAKTWLVSLVVELSPPAVSYGGLFPSSSDKAFASLTSGTRTKPSYLKSCIKRLARKQA